MTSEIILSFVFLACLLFGCIFCRKRQSFKKKQRYVVGFDTSDVNASTTEEEPQPRRDPTLIDLEPTEDCFEIDYDEEDDDCS